MARGMQKIQAQQKAQGKKGAKKGSQIGLADKKQTTVCQVCKQSMVDLKQLKMHYESKHSKLPLPDECK